MNTATYRNILRVLEKWPIDSTKLGRDFGEYIRKEVATAFRPQEAKALDIQAWDTIEASLNRIASDRYRTLYPVPSSVATSTGLISEHCQVVLSDDFRKEIEEKELPIYKKALNKLRGGN